MPKIVVLDGYTTNPGDLSWEPLAALGELETYDRTPRADVLARSQGASILLSNKTFLHAEHIAQLPELQYIGVFATGYNVIDIDAAREHGVVVCNVPHYSTEAVAQHTMALLLRISNHVAPHSDAVHQGKWQRSKDFCFINHPMFELQGLTMGIIGYGSIGAATARCAQAFGMNILAYKRTPPKTSPAGVTFVDIEQIFRESDIISLHCPLTPATEKLVNAERIALMKENAILLNTSRGGLVDENALAHALREKRLYAAGVDVLSSEPPKADNPLIGLENCYITPHIAWAARETRQRLLNVVTDNVRAFLNGKPQNVVN